VHGPALLYVQVTKEPLGADPVNGEPSLSVGAHWIELDEVVDDDVTDDEVVPQEVSEGAAAEVDVRGFCLARAWNAAKLFGPDSTALAEKTIPEAQWFVCLQ